VVGDAVAPEVSDVALGTPLRSAGFVVYDYTTCIVGAARRFSSFSIGSCGQCPPCKLGSNAITQLLERMETGSGTDGDLRSRS